MSRLTLGSWKELLTEHFARHEPAADGYLLFVPSVSKEEYWSLTDEDTRWEYIDGEVVMHSPASLGHQDEEGFLSSLARFFVEQRDLGKVFAGNAAIQLDTDRLLVPDVLFVSTANLNRLKEHYVEGACDWLCEVCSPSTRRYDLGVKAALYREHGVGETWMVDVKDRLVHVSSRNTDGTYTQKAVSSGRLESSAIPGFWLDVGWLWARPLPKVRETVDRILAG